MAEQWSVTGSRALRAAGLLAAGLAAACGGGGGGGSGLSLSLSPSSVSATYYANNSASITVGAHVQGTVNGTVYVIIVDSAQVLQGTPTITQLGPSSYSAVLNTVSTLAVGDHRGSLQVLLCGDQQCATRYASADLGYDLNVLPYPLPALSGISPSGVIAGSAAPALTLNGSNFTQQSVVLWNGSPRGTQYVSATQLEATLLDTDVADGAVVPVTVSNPAPGGGASQAQTFTVSNPVPALAAINADTAAPGCTAFTLYVMGSGFVPSSVVQWNGQARSTSRVPATLLQAQITAADVVQAGTAQVVVSSRQPGGGLSTAAGFSVSAANAVTTEATAFQIDPGHSGAAHTRCPLSLPAGPTWTVSHDGAISYPLIAGGGVYYVTNHFNSNYTLFGLNAADGSALWPSIDTNSQGAPGGPAYDAGKVLVVGSSVVQGWNAANGHQLWTQPLSQGAFSGLSAANGRVFVSGIGNTGSGGDVFAFDDGTGAPLWEGDVNGSFGAIPSVTASGVYTSYTCTTALAPASGAALWTFGSCSSNALGYGLTTVVADGAVYAPTLLHNYDGNVLDAASGAATGTYTSDLPPAVSGGQRYVMRNATLFAENAAGTVLWSFAGDGSLVTSAIVVNKIVFVGSAQGKVYGLDAATGQLLWQSDVGAQIPGGQTLVNEQTAALAEGDGVLVVPTVSGLTGFVLTAP